MAVSKRRRRQRAWALALTPVILLAAAGGGGYWLGYHAAAPKLAQKSRRLGAANRALAQQVEGLRATQQQLLSGNIGLQRSAQIDHDALASARDSLHELQEKVSKLKKRVAFYRSIVSPSADGEGVRAYSFDVYPAKKKRAYTFTLTLIQSGHNDQRARGRARFSLSGATEGEQDNVPMGDLLVDKKKPLAFSFHYFQELHGTLKLPDGFQPRTVTVRVERRGKKDEEQHYQWDKVVRNGAKQAKTIDRSAN